MADKTVVVTGANGFIASWIVKHLLERGYKVRGTVRNPNDVMKVGHLFHLPGAKERLTLFRAELLEQGVFDEVVLGADYVVHTATPFALGKLDDAYKELIDPSVEGTLNLLRSAAKAKTVKRFVYTSSVAAVYYSPRFLDRKEGDIVDESWWSDSDFCLKESLYYHAGKTLAERAAFEFARNANFDVVSILPSNTVGTMLQKAANGSCNEIARILKGMDRPQDRLARIRHALSLVDVEDVAMAHILALENPDAEGRYLTIGFSMSNDQLALVLAKQYPEYSSVIKPPMEGKDEETFMEPIFKFSTEKLRNLGLSFTPLPDTLQKAVKSLKQLDYGVTCWWAKRVRYYHVNSQGKLQLFLYSTPCLTILSSTETAFKSTGRKTPRNVL
ncbi:hypothetical protein R1sor_011524 [Riccia sorocarpa]|uniref:NAD-dependent epimerase/dehydratase domain-containing protein n=1 Tax=Riccia sorocarpa TaxID=122646 RepID=A0ABD3I1I0_9MARC